MLGDEGWEPCNKGDSWSSYYWYLEVERWTYLAYRK
jgi:hypothetical protein